MTGYKNQRHGAMSIVNHCYCGAKRYIHTHWNELNKKKKTIRI